MSGFSWTIQENAHDLTLTEQTVTMTIAENTITLGGGGGATNLGYTASPTNGIVTSDTGTDATIIVANGTNAGLMTPANFTKLAGIETGADVTDAANVTAAGAFMKSVDDTDDITEGNNKFATAAEKAKLANISITQAVDLDAIESRVNDLDAAVVLKGAWDASAGTFPGGGVAQAGWSYVVSVSGTVDGVAFTAGDRIICLLDNGSTTTYLNNWLKADYSDLVASLDGTTGALTLGSIIANLTGKTTPVNADSFALSDSENSNASKKVTFTNFKAFLKTYFDALYQAASSVLTNLVSVWTPASASSAASLAFHEDTDNGTNKVTVTAPASVASDKTITLPDETGTILTTASGVSKSSVPCEFIVACSDETTALTTGTAKVTFRAPYAFTLTAVRASLTTAQTSGSIFTVDINESGTSVLSTKLTIDNTEKTSTTAATAAVISDSAIADDAEITIDIDQVGDGTAKGLKVVLIGTHAV